MLFSLGAMRILGPEYDRGLTRPDVRMRYAAHASNKRSDINYVVA
jgi:hypothetical protein